MEEDDNILCVSVYVMNVSNIQMQLAVSLIFITDFFFFICFLRSFHYIILYSEYFKIKFSISIHTVVWTKWFMFSFLFLPGKNRNYELRSQKIIKKMETPNVDTCHKSRHHVLIIIIDISSPHTHTHTHIHIYIYICVCVCVCESEEIFVNPTREK